jgi:ABC-type multidrug transport system ATPase subunit
VPDAAEGAPQLLVQSSGATRLLPDGDRVRYTIGRDGEADFELTDARVSWEHAVLRADGTVWVLEDLDSRNGTFAASGRVTRLEITGPSEVHFGRPGDGPVMRFELVAPDGGRLPAAEATRPGVDTNPTVIRRLSDKVTGIGRAGDNQFVVADLAVSKKHAELRRSATGRYQIVDLNSHNGTYVNGVRVHRAELTEDDLVSIGHSTFRLVGGELREHVDEGRASFAARDVMVTVSEDRKRKTLLDGITFPLAERSMMAVIGPAGAGKSTLLNALTGKNQATSGAVLYDNRDLYQNYDALRDRIGLVPQDSVTHDALTAREALGYAAELRFSSDVGAGERRQRIEAVLGELEMSGHGDTRIERLSGGQNKRVNIGLELLTKPSMLFLDEPTSPLDPHLKRQLFQRMRAMADKNAADGQSVVVITHDVDPGLLGLCDRLLVLAPGGRMAYFGPPKEGLKYFGKAEWADVFQAFADEPGADWARKFQASAEYLKYVVMPMAPLLRESAPAAPQPKESVSGRRRGLLTQAFIMARRQFRVMATDKVYLGIAAGFPLVLGAVFRLMISGQGLGGSLAQRNPGAAEPLLILTVAACLSGAASSVAEIVKERGIFQRERMAGIAPLAYLLSKIMALGLVSLAQAVIIVLVGLIGRPGPSSGSAITGLPFLELGIAVAVTCFVSMLVGLLISGLATKIEQVLFALVGVTLFQIMFSGGVFPLKSVLSQVSGIFPARWGLAMLASTANLNVIQPNGSGRDALWNHARGQWLTDLVALSVIGLVCFAVTWWRLAATGSRRRRWRLWPMSRRRSLEQAQLS